MAFLDLDGLVQKATNSSHSPLFRSHTSHSDLSDSCHFCNSLALLCTAHRSPHPFPATVTVKDLRTTSFN